MLLTPFLLISSSKGKKRINKDDVKKRHINPRKTYLSTRGKNAIFCFYYIRGLGNGYIDFICP